MKSNQPTKPQPVAPKGNKGQFVKMPKSVPAMSDIAMPKHKI